MWTVFEYLIMPNGMHIGLGQMHAICSPTTVLVTDHIDHILQMVMPLLSSEAGKPQTTWGFQKHQMHERPWHTMWRAGQGEVHPICTGHTMSSHVLRGYWQGTHIKDWWGYYYPGALHKLPHIGKLLVICSMAAWVACCNGLRWL